MESSALEAMCDFKGLSFYTFFLSGDIIVVDGWDRSDLGTQNEHKKQLSSFDIAILISKNIK